MITIGYITALLIGLSLGLIGGGGSILTVPILVYLFDVPPVLATSYSLFIVGVTSMVGTVDNLFRKNVDINTALTFGPLSVLTVFCIRHYVIPYLPVSIYIGRYSFTFSLITMVLFGVLMMVSSLSMLKDETDKSARDMVHKAGFIKIAVYGIIVGVVTGLLGAGGGFLLIPALTLLLHLPIKKAIGTSLFIITINSLIGFADDVTHHQMNWPMLLKITLVSIVGIIIGSLLAKRINGAVLKKGFAWFVLLMGVYIIFHEMLSLV